MYNAIKIGIVCISLLLFFCNCNSKTKEPSKTMNITQEKMVKATNTDKKVILFFGNSLTAGYGLEQEEAYSFIIQKKIDSLQLPYRCINAGLSGDTTAGGLGRIDWVLKEPVDLFLLELGANDGLRGISPEETEKNLNAIIDKVRATSKDTQILLAGMKVPPNMGENYAVKYEAIFPRVAKEKEVTLIPFFLEGVAGNPKFNQADRIHPTAAGTKIVANTVWNAIENFIKP